MARRGLSEASKREAAIQASTRMIARGERPLYRVRTALDGSYAIVGSPWLPVPVVGRRESLAAVRVVIAAELDVPADAFDVAME